MNQSIDDEKKCIANITYGTNCNQLLDVYIGMDTSDSVTTPQLELMDDTTEYCFIVTASSGTMTIAVKGNFHGNSKLDFYFKH